ncbi:hypothetical protein LTR86_004890 [Recurvomyces mirabilis]|nr:hypothetical protein LTR86_004890 [Recurvomyces mirabilis]
MARPSRRLQALVLLSLSLLSAAPLAQAQLSNLPDLSTATQTTAKSTSSSAATSATSSAASTTSGASFTATATGATSIFHLSDVPTIAGAGIPTLVIPYTAAAPFMQKSKLPEGTVFIAVGAVLAFLGACVLLWRGLIAWSINRSVRKSALASIRGSEKSSKWGGGTSTGYNPVHGGGGGGGGHYKDYNGSVMSLDALTKSGKPIGKQHLAGHDIKRESTPPAGLFFSPTAQAGTQVQNNRASSYLPAGYYASPSAQPAGGAGATTIGGSLAPYARHSTIAPSPPSSPGIPNSRDSRSSATYRNTSRDGLRAPSRETAGNTRNSYYDGNGNAARSSALYAQPSNSSLMVGVGGHEGARMSRHSPDGLGTGQQTCVF